MTSRSAASAAGLSTLDDCVARVLAVDDDEARRQILGQALRRFPADDLLPYLKVASERYFMINAHAALQLGEVLVEAARMSGRPDHLPFGLMAKADALRSLGRYHDSVALYEEAGRR